MKEGYLIGMMIVLNYDMCRCIHVVHFRYPTQRSPRLGIVTCAEHSIYIFIVCGGLFANSVLHLFFVHVNRTSNTTTG